MEYRVAIIIYCLESGNTLIMIVNLFELGDSTTSKIIRECCQAIRILLKSLVFMNPSLAWMKKIATKFKALHGISLIIRAIDGSHKHLPNILSHTTTKRSFIHVYCKEL